MSRCRHGRLFFLFPHKGGGRKESEKEREIKSTRVKLAQRAGFKTRDETATPVLAARGPPSSQPRPHRARRPHRREPDLMFHKALSQRGKGQGSCLCRRESADGQSEAKQTKGRGAVTVLPPPPLRNFILSPPGQANDSGNIDFIAQMSQASDFGNSQGLTKITNLPGSREPKQLCYRWDSQLNP